MSVVVDKPLSIIGSSKWKNSTVSELKLANQVISRCERQVQSARALNPIGGLREECTLSSNAAVLRYTRDVRTVVCYLHRGFAEANEEIKALTNSKDEVEKLLDHLRKDLKLNQHSNELRSIRPRREMLEDGADKLITAERRKLLQVKKNVEGSLRATKEKAEQLRVGRDKLSSQLKERTRVLDLLCHTYNTRPTTSPRFAEEELPDLSCDPLGPYTPKVKEALTEGVQLRQSSTKQRSQNSSVLERSRRTVDLVHNAVNTGLQLKSTETKVMVTNLGLKIGEQGHVINKTSRQAIVTELAYEKTMGPKSTEHLKVAEKLNRPLLKIYHRHPGRVVTEGASITAGAGQLFSTLQDTRHNIKLIQASKDMLSLNHTDKKSGLFVDKDVLRLRKRRANHRWVMGPPGLYTQ